MSDNDQAKARESNDSYYSKLDEHLDDLHETVKEELKTLPKVREELSNHQVSIASMIGPGLGDQLEKRAMDVRAESARADANLLELERQLEENQRELLALRHKDAGQY